MAFHQGFQCKSRIQLIIMSRPPHNKLCKNFSAMCFSCVFFFFFCDSQLAKVMLISDHFTDWHLFANQKQNWHTVICNSHTGKQPLHGMYEVSFTEKGCHTAQRVPTNYLWNKKIKKSVKYNGMTKQRIYQESVNRNTWVKFLQAGYKNLYKRYTHGCFTAWAAVLPFCH